MESNRGLSTSSQSICRLSLKLLEELLFFNACFSYDQAFEVIQHVDAAIGMTTSVSDEAACAFAAQFYSSLGFGLSVKRDFEQAKRVMMLESPTGAFSQHKIREYLSLCGEKYPLIFHFISITQ